MPTETSGLVAGWATFVIGILSFVFCGVLANGRKLMQEGSTAGIILVRLQQNWSICLQSCVQVVLLSLITVLLALFLLVLHRQPQSNTPVAFKVENNAHT